MTPRIAIIGGGISGLTLACELSRAGHGADVTLFESTSRLGGIVETVHRNGFTIECGPDGWLTGKPWARELAIELGLGGQLLPSLDAGRRTYILNHGRLDPIPDGMQMMVPTDLDTLTRSPLFSPSAIRAFHAELHRAATLRANAPKHDESVADLVLRHFGDEVLHSIAAPLLSGVFGGDVFHLSARAVLPRFVALEREHGSLILGLQRELQSPRPHAPPSPIAFDPSGSTSNNDARSPITSATAPPSIFTTLRDGLGAFTDALEAQIPTSSIRLCSPVLAITRSGSQWSLRFHDADTRPGEAETRQDHAGPGALAPGRAGSPTLRTRHETFDTVILATSLAETRRLLRQIDPHAAALLPTHTSSAIIVAFAWSDPSLSLRDRRRTGKRDFTPPPGFGLLVPPRPGIRGAFGPQILAATFTDGKFPHRVPSGGRLLRAFFGAAAAERLWRSPDHRLADRALGELRRILGPLPAAPPITVLRRWPQSLPQYQVGHLDRAAALARRLQAKPGMHLLGNAVHGVGLPDLVREARALARDLSA